MVTFEIPKVETLVGTDKLSSVLTVVHYLLNALFKQEQALLHAEFRPPQTETVWYLRRRTNGEEGEDEKLVVLPSSIVSSFIARLAVDLDINYTEGGYGRFEIKQGNKRQDCRVFLSRCKDSGIWVRVYGRII